MGEAPTPTHEGIRRVWRFSWWFIFSISLLLFIISVGINNCPKHHPTRPCAMRWLGTFSFQNLKENPLLGPGSRALVRMGALDPRRTSRKRQEWRLFTCLWLHAGLFHLIVTLLGLIFVGARLEWNCGTLTVAGVYIASGIGGALWSALLLVPANISVGGSFPLFGLIGMTCADLAINGSEYINKATAGVTLGLVAAIELIFGLMPFVDNWGHIGAFITGLVLGYLILIKPLPSYSEACQQADEDPLVKGGIDLRPKHRLTPVAEVLRVLCYVILILGFTIAIVALFSGADHKKHCKWCRYLNCVNTRAWKCPAVGGYSIPPESKPLPTKLVCLVRKRNDNIGWMICKNGSMQELGDLSTRSQEWLRQQCSRICG